MLQLQYLSNGLYQACLCSSSYSFLIIMPDILIISADSASICMLEKILVFSYMQEQHKYQPLAE